MWYLILARGNERKVFNMTNEQAKAIIESMLKKAGWTVAENGDCHAE